MGKGVGTSFVRLHCKPAYAQAKHAQYLNGRKTIRQDGRGRCSHSKITVTMNTTEDTTVEQLL